MPPELDGCRNGAPSAAVGGRYGFRITNPWSSNVNAAPSVFAYGSIPAIAATSAPQTRRARADDGYTMAAGGSSARVFGTMSVRLEPPARGAALGRVVGDDHRTRRAVLAIARHELAQLLRVAHEPFLGDRDAVQRDVTKRQPARPH